MFELVCVNVAPSLSKAKIFSFRSAEVVKNVCFVWIGSKKRVRIFKTICVVYCIFICRSCRTYSPFPMRDFFQKLHRLCSNFFWLTIFLFKYFLVRIFFPNFFSAPFCMHIRCNAWTNAEAFFTVEHST